MALTDLTRISTAGIATGSTIDSPILRKDVNFRGNQVGVTSVLFDSSEKRLDLKDNVNLTFGDDGDLKLYHNGSHSYIDETGTGNLYIRNGTKNSIWCKTGGQVNLYFNDEKKFETAETGAAVTGILTATSFSGPIVGNTNNSSGISTFYDLRVSNNLTVEGTTTTIDTNLINVDRIEVGANSSTTVAVSVAQTGSADIINLFDGNTEVLTVTDGGNVGIGYTNPDVPLKVNGVIQSSSAFRVAGHPVVSYSSFNLGSGAYATRLGSTGTTTLRHTQIYAGGSHQATFDGVNNRLGIGITNPLRKVDVVGNSLLVRPTIDNISSSGNASAVNNSIIVRMPYGENAASTTNAGARFGIQFTGANNTTDVSSLNFGNDPIKSASIYGVSEDNLGYSRKVGMVFYTSNLDIAQRERLRIASDGKVAMGLTSTSGGKCDPESNHLLIRGASTVGTKSGHIMLTGDSATIDQGPQIVFSESGSGANWAGAYIGHERKGGGSQGDLVFATRQETGDADTVPVEALRITSAGKIEVKGTRSGDLQANDDDSLKLFTKSTTNAINRGAGITFYTHDGSGYEMGGTIQVAKENADADDPKSYMRFSTQNGSTTTERLRIKSGGQTIVKGEDDQDNFMVDVAGTQFAVHTDGTDGEISLRAQDGSGSDNSKYMTFFTHPSGSAAEERIRITSSGDVGIGTASPTEKLDVRGYLVVAEKIAVNRSRIVLSAPDGGNYRHLFGANLKVIDDGTYTTPSQNISGGGWEYLPANSLNSHGKIRYMSAPDTNATSSTPEERLRIDGAGRVLIGLDSSTQADSYMQVFKKTGNSATMTIGNVATAANGLCRVDFCPSNKVVGSRIECHATEDFASTANRTADLVFITRNNGVNGEKLRIKSTGNVGIGYTNPNAKFHIASGTSSAVGDATNPAFQIGNTTNYRFAIHTTNEQAIIANKNGDDGIAFHTKTGSGGSFGETVLIDDNGQVGINTNMHMRGRVTIRNTNGFSSASISNNSDNIYLISNTSSADNAYGASIGFSRVQYPDRRAAAITTVQTGTDEDKVGLSFWTHPSTDAAANIEEKLRISATGVVHHSNDVDEMTWSRQTGRAQHGNGAAVTYSIKTFYYGIATFKIALSDGNLKWAHLVVEIGGMQYTGGGQAYNATVVANSTGNGPSISLNQQDGGYHITITNGGNSNTLFGSWVLEGTSYTNRSIPTLETS